jgi:hypothetical protein
MMKEIHHRVGRCHIGRVVDATVSGAKVALDCDRGNMVARISITQRAPYLIDSFGWTYEAPSN